MSARNNCIFVGRLTRDPEMEEVGKDSISLTKFSLAIDRKDIGNEEVDYPDFECWGKLAERVAEHLGKGSQVCVEARYKESRWKDKETGKSRKGVSFTARDVQFLGSKQEG